ncbi:hypothetical protein ID007_004306 [Salmonella enterica]|nr:hypothetical protein [Salmonella enterica]
MNQESVTVSNVMDAIANGFMPGGANTPLSAVYNITSDIAKVMTMDDLVKYVGKDVEDDRAIILACFAYMAKAINEGQSVVRAEVNGETFEITGTTYQFGKNTYSDDASLTVEEVIAHCMDVEANKDEERTPIPEELMNFDNDIAF